MKSHHPKILVIGAPASGSGKTTLCAGLARLWTQKGLVVQCFKVGPDYLDPGFLALASSRPCPNLDIWMHGADAIEQRVRIASKDADLILIEGVKGLYDGADPRSAKGSTAHIARMLDAPLLLVADASGSARSFAALVQGFAEFADAPDVMGCIANRIGGSVHAQMLQDALESTRMPLPLLGAIPGGILPQLCSRHLGLVQVSEDPDSDHKLDQIAQILDENLDYVGIADRAKPMPSYPFKNLQFNDFSDLCIGIAQDQAFSFYYPDLLDGLRLRGVQICPFSPIDSAHLPPDCDALIFGGGYPELHAQALSDNVSLLQEIRDFACTGAPIYGECGGLIYLSSGIRRPNEDNTENTEIALVGLYPRWTQIHTQIQCHSYAQITPVQESLWGDAGDQLRGHEFHYSSLDELAPGWRHAYLCTDAGGHNPRPEGFQKGNLLLSYVHLPLGVQSQALDHFLTKVRLEKVKRSSRQN